MLYAFLCCHDEAVVNSWSKEEDAAVLAKRALVTARLAAKGQLGAAVRLMPTTAATTLRMGRELVVLDGPFAETKEALLGFYLIDCDSLEDATDIAKEMGRDEKAVFEIRPVRLFLPKGKAPGSVMVVEFEIDGQTFTALNGGPHFKFDEAVSFQIMCKSQDEIDRFWTRLSEGGQAGQCGGLKDRFGLSWQVVPAALPQMITNAGDEQLDRLIGAVMAMKKMAMKKFDLQALGRAYAG